MSNGNPQWRHPASESTARPVMGAAGGKMAAKSQVKIAAKAAAKALATASTTRDSGPGTALATILQSLGITDQHGCDCTAFMRQMDAWGVAGCRQRRDEIIGRLRNGQEKWGWVARFKAAALAIGTGLAFRLNPLDPFPGLVDEAIRQAEVAATACQATSPLQIPFRLPVPPSS